jgi:hypothetical protein
MKSYNFSFRVYQNKLKALPGFLAFLIILLFILLIPVLFIIILVGGIAFMLISGAVSLFLPGKKEKEIDGNTQIIEISEEKNIT